MKNNIITLVGGDFDNNNGKESGIVKKMMRQFGFNGNCYINGGNLSTRCQRLFPTQRTNNYMYVSPRNTDKERLSANDFVLYNPDSSSYVMLQRTLQTNRLLILQYKEKFIRNSLKLII